MADSLRIRVRVTPNARRWEWSRTEDGGLAVKVVAPPVEGAANDALLRWMAKELLHVPRSAVKLVLGDRSREKVLEIALSPEELEKKLAEA